MLKKIGTCALCQRDAVLRNSHLIPQWAYKRVCNVDPLGAKDPVHIANGNAFFSSKQTTKYLIALTANSVSQSARIMCPDSQSWTTGRSNFSEISRDWIHRRRYWLH